MSKITKLFIATVFLMLLMTNTNSVFAQEEGSTVDDTGNNYEDYENSYDEEKINLFDVDIKVNEDSSLLVTEKIEYDFGSYQKHGIYRYIPFKYKDQYFNKFNLRYDVLSVVDENGRAYNYEVTREGNNFYIKIGDADIYVSGIKIYQISYKIERALNYFSDYDELYWNVTGNEWFIGMEQVSATIHLPGTFQTSDIRMKCFTGYYGLDDETSCDFATSGERSVIFKTSGPLGYYEGLTIVFGFPKGIVIEPDFWQKLQWFLWDNWFVFVPFIVFVILLRLYWVKGRDIKDTDIVVAQYESYDGLTPLEVGTLIDEKVDISDISATIIGLAAKGYLTIEEIINKKLWIFSDKDYKFTKLKEFSADSQLKKHEKLILEGIFKGDKEIVKMSDLKNEFYTKLSAIKKDVYKSMVKDGYFVANPDSVRWIYYGIGLFWSLFSVCFIGFFIIFMSTTAFLSFFLSGVLFLIFAPFMPKKTKKGVEALNHVKGFEEYLQVAEKDRLIFSEGNNVFEKFLPYAMVLGVAGSWANKFKDMYTKNPDWYKSSSQFNSYQLIHALDSFSSASNSTLRSAPRSSGSSSWSGGSGFSGGSSGGGFGGGGGGSW